MPNLDRQGSISFEFGIELCMKKLMIVLLIFAFVFGLTACGKKDDIVDLSKDLSTYNMDISLDTSAKSVQARLDLTYVNNTDAMLDEVRFHLYPQFFEEGATEHVVSNTKLNDAYPNGMSYAEFDVTRVQVSNEDRSVVYSGEYEDILVVTLDSSLLPGDRASIIIEFSFILPNCEHRFGYGDNTINLANFYPIACVFEAGKFNESPYNANGDPFYSDMANYNVTISVNDAGYVVAGTGDKVDSRVDNGEYMTSFRANLVRDFALVVSDDFECKTASAGDTEVLYYFFGDSSPDSSLQAGVDAINTFNKLFGAYPYSSFSIVETDFIHGGMEYPTLIMISSDIENHDDYMNVIVHETAHQWWYGMVGNDEYKYPWLDEALTEYSTLLFYDENDGYNLTHSEMLDANRSNYTLFINVYEDVLGTIDTSMRAVDEYDTEPEYTYCTYVKGVLMYESLYQLLGEKTFISGLQEYFSANKYKNATPDDLISAFESASNTVLKNFFNSWIEGKVVIR